MSARQQSYRCCEEHEDRGEAFEFLQYVLTRLRGRRLQFELDYHRMDDGSFALMVIGNGLAVGKGDAADESSASGEVIHADGSVSLEQSLLGLGDDDDSDDDEDDTDACDC